MLIEKKCDENIFKLLFLKKFWGKYGKMITFVK